MIKTVSSPQIKRVEISIASVRVSFDFFLSFSHCFAYILRFITMRVCIIIVGCVLFWVGHISASPKTKVHKVPGRECIPEKQPENGNCSLPLGGGILDKQGKFVPGMFEIWSILFVYKCLVEIKQFQNSDFF